MQNNKERFARFYRVQYVITATVAIVSLILIWVWSNRKHEEKTYERIMTMCITSCITEMANEAGERANVFLSECIISCQKEYGKNLDEWSDIIKERENLIIN